MDFLTATINAIGEISKEEALAAIEREWPRILRERLDAVPSPEPLRVQPSEVDLRQELEAAFEAGHWSWPTAEDGPRATRRERYVVDRLAALRLQPSRAPSEEK